jgi:thioesterase domain-containing protein
MKQSSGVEIALGDVFRSPTIAGLVTHLGPDAVKNASVIVPLQQEGNGLPIFCICGINIYKAFAQSLGKDQPVFGVYVEEEQAIINQVLRGDTPEISIERLVEAYDKAIARLYPRGPYRLAGLSFGGILAMELASKLRRRGEQVDLVFLLDTILPEGRHRNWLKWFSRQVAEFMAGQGRAKLQRLYASLRDRILKRPPQPGLQRSVGHVDEAFRNQRGAVFFQASRQWKPHSSIADFPVVLFQASNHFMSGQDIELDPDYGWRRYLGEWLSIIDVSGGHISIIEPPNVADLGRKARRYLGTIRPSGQN